MNQSLSSDRKSLLFHRMDLLQKYDLCRKQSPCYLLLPPPQPPTLPELILDNSSLTLTNHQPYTHSFFITLSLFIALACICLFSIIFQIFYKLRQAHHQMEHTHLSNNTRSTTFSKIVPSSYNSLTPLTCKTDQSPASTITNIFNLSHQHHLPYDDQSLYHNHSSNIYEKIRLSSDHRYCSCCLCVQAYYQKQQQYISTTRQLTPYYYRCESSSPPTNVVCQNCLLETLHRKQSCFCHNFFVPIK